MSAPIIVPATRTGGSGSGADRDAWIRSRHAALVTELERRGVGNAWNIAMAPVAHWGDETRWGRSEYDYAPGNIRNVGQCPLAHMLQGSDDPVPRPYCAYRSIDEGIARTLDLILAPRYAGSWRYLTSTGDAVGWFDRLMREGWHPWSQDSLDSFRSEYARVQRTVGAAPAPALSWASYVAGGLFVAAAAWWIATDRR